MRGTRFRAWLGSGTLGVVLVSRSIGVVALLVLAGCDLAAPEPAPVEFRPPPPLLTSRPTPTGPSCTFAWRGYCNEYPPHRYATGPGTDPRFSCELARGTWSDGPCPREGTIGDCSRIDGMVTVYAAGHASEAATDCEPHGAYFFAAPGAEPLPSLAAAPDVAGTPAPVAPRREPRYRIEAPARFVPWDAPFHPGLRTLEAHRSERGFGRTRGHVILIVRVAETSPGATLAETIPGRVEIMEANGVHAISHRETSSAGPPGVLWDETSHAEDGEATRVLTLQVLDGSLLYTLTCGSAAATFATWRPMCERALGSFRVLPD